MSSTEAIHQTICEILSGEFGQVSLAILNKVCADLIKNVAEGNLERPNASEKIIQYADMIDAVVLAFENGTFNQVINDMDENARTEIVSLPYYLIAAFCSRTDGFLLCAQPEMTEFGKSVFRNLNPITMLIIFKMLADNTDYYISSDSDDFIHLFKYITQEQNAEHWQQFRNLCASFIAAFFTKKRPGYDDMINSFTPTFINHPNYNDLQAFAAALYDYRM